MTRTASPVLLALACLALAPPARPADVTLATADGLALVLDGATGRVRSIELDGLDYTDPALYGGLYVRDREHLLDVPPSSVNLADNPSFESDLDLDGRPDGWTFDDAYGLGATMLYGSDALDGVKSVTVERRAGGALYGYNYGVVPGRRYRFSVMAKGSSSAYIYVVWKTADGNFLYYESGKGRPASTGWTPLHVIAMAPENAGLVDLGIVSGSDGDVTFDRVRFDEAPPATFSQVAGPVTQTGAIATQTATLPALGLSFTARYEALADRIDVDVRVSDTSNADRALESGFIAPVVPFRFWDALGRSRPITQLTYAETFAYTWWGGIYNDGHWGSDRSMYPFAAVTIGSETHLAMGNDVQAGPQDVQYFHSTHIGEGFTSLFRLGLAAETVRSPRAARYRFHLFRASGPDGFRAALDRTYKMSGTTFENRVPVAGSWTPWRTPASIPNAADFGIAMHTYPEDVAADDQASVLTLGYVSSFDNWLDLTDMTARPTRQQVIDRLNFNATDPGVDPTQQADARATIVSGMHEPNGEPLFDLYQASWLPGSGWAAVCGVNPDPEITDRTSNGWTSRYAQRKASLDAMFAAATRAGAVLDGAYFNDFRGWNYNTYNHRRTHFETTDIGPSFDPANFKPALAESFSHWDAIRTVADEMHAKGLITMAHDIHYPSFWATAAIDAMGVEVDRNTLDNDEALAYFRSVAGRKPYFMLYDADFATADVAHAMRKALLYGFLFSPFWDSAADAYFWDNAAHVARDRPLYRRFVALHRLQSRAGFEPVTEAAASVPEVRLERFGRKTGGLLLWSAWNSSATDPADGTVTIDLARLGLAPGEVGRVVDLLEGGLPTTTVIAGKLEIRDTLAPDAARLYHLHLKGGAPLVLKAAKRGGDVDLVWTDAGRDPYEVFTAAQETLAGATVDLASTPARTDAGAIAAPGNRFYAVE